ncbi:cadherin [Thiothrix lacustris]|uniref:Cadherin n=1 Tax=Thiothrix lacustris TaxID=525917 RepID=A0ABY9MMQ5_9GAMM|nr:cadherin [Thiothrix lacustris]WML89949.1 cadherin [Thiothrix lacustris]
MMKTAMYGFAASLKSSVALLALLSASNVMADVQFRIAYEADSSEYVIYMKPDVVPSPDMALSAQVTLSVPHGVDSGRFDALSIHSVVDGLAWINHSRVDAPVENPDADYLSFGLQYTKGRAPNFGWQAGEEMRIFSFASPTGCSSKVALLENADPFNQLPNSVNTNPGNDFMNVGWLQGYTGNYGNAVQCPGQAALPPAVDVSLTTQLEDKIKKLEAQLLSCQAANNVSAIERAVIPMLKGQNKRLSSR